MTPTVLRNGEKTTETGDEIAWRTSKISRSICRTVAEFTFAHAKRTGAKVFGRPQVHRQRHLRRHV